MAGGVWISSHCLHTEGFPKLLYATMQRLGIQERPEYEGREYEEHGTERCEVTIYIAKSDDFPDIAEAWSMTATGFRFADTYQAVARKALRHLCQIYEEPIARTPMRFFPPLEKNQPVWIARMEALQGQEDNPTMKYMTTYLLALDEQHDRQASELRKCIHRAEEAEIYARKLHIQLAEAQAQAAAARSRETAIAEALKEAEDRHAQQLKDAYLVTRAKRRMFALEGQEPIILEGIPIMSPGRRMDAAGPSAPPPTEASHEVSETEPPLPLTQPPPRDNADPSPSPAEGPQEPGMKPSSPMK
jgi:hypothetical protein